MIFLRLPLLLLSLFVLGGCAAGMLSQSGSGVPVIDGRDVPLPEEQTAATRSMNQPVPYPQPGPILPPQSRSNIDNNNLPATSPAVVALLDNAEKEIQVGRYDRAVASIERALRVEPQNALLWSKLASIRLAQRNWQQASVLAGRSNSLARNNHALQVQNWRIIAQSKAMLGDSAGAATARQKILQLGEGNF